ncbi:MBG domain-containing protein [Blastomonas fulva]|uniref:MBG domain-containing protein n=2 Tax=Blastomonas fulva TaxID=1550728 RepID=UPI0040383ACD
MTITRTPEQRARHWANWQIALRTGVAGLAIVTTQTALANPSGGNVVAGNATINGQGTDRVRIDQSSDRVIINWDNFSIGSGQGVDFRQPGTRSIALNRVTGPEISQIMGELTANGQVYLINGNGIVFGKDARVDVAGLVATSADIGNAAFMAGGTLRFGTPGRSGARVINHGTITVRDAGVAAFVAPQVANHGIITAHMGKIAFGGAQAFTLDLHGDNLIRFQVGDAVTRLDDKGALVDIGGVVDARGGSLLITASAARDLVNQSVRIGTPQAASMEVGADGKVSLVAAKMTITAPGEVQVGRNVAMELSSATNAVVTGARPAKGSATSNIGWANVIDGDASAAPGTAMAASGTGGTLTITAARTILDGTINLDGGKAGGTAHITGSEFLSFGSILSASGAEAGGNIQLDAGGFSLAGRITVNAGLGKGGNVGIHTTRRAIDTGDAFIDASGLHGGTIRYTSDQQIISSGKFRASGSHGFGGSIDVSAPRLDLFSAQFYAQGGIRGGRVRLGGEFQGGKGLSGDELPNARTLVATDAVTIDVSAIGMRGNAGEIVVWSDEKTTFLGSAIARGGMVGGVGGQIEISGKETLVYRGTVETARDGQRGGKLLLDPKNIIIADGSNAPSQYGLVLQAFASSFPGPAAPMPGVDFGDLFGFGVSLDGDRLAVGAPGDDGADGSLTNVGAVYLFTFADTSFAALVLSAVVGSGYTGGRNLSVGGLEAGDQFGFSVSLTGTRLAVGAPFDDGLNNAAPDSGAVYLFSFLDLAFNASSTLGVLGAGYGGTASLDVANLEAGDRFGASISLDRVGNRLAVGASHDDGGSNTATDSGAVYLFSFTDAQFSDPALESIIGFNYSGGKNLSVGQLVTDDRFGYSVSLEGTQLAIGAPGDDGDSGSATDAGAVYLVSFADAAFNSPLVEGIIGSGYLGSKDFNVPGFSEDRLGDSVSLNGNRLAVGAPFNDGVSAGLFNNGAVYLFTFADTSFSSPGLAAIIGGDHGSLGGRNLSIPQLSFNDNFGKVSLDGNRLVVGAPRDEGRNNNLGNAGAAYLFTFEDDAFNTGRQVGLLGAGYFDFSGLSLLGTGLEEQDNFGTAVSLDGSRLAVGARFDDGAGNARIDSGAVYLFTFGDAQFSAPVLQSIIGSGYSGGKNISVGRLEADDLFGSSVSLDGLRLAVGAIGDDGTTIFQGDAGAVYLFTFEDASFTGGGLARLLNFESFSGGGINASSSFFGSAVSLDGNVIAVGAQGDPGFGGFDFEAGAVHIFDLGDPMFAATPQLLTTLGQSYSSGAGVSVVGLEAGDRFGTSVSLDGLRLAVGAPNDAGALTPITNAGAVYLFTFTLSDYSDATLAATLGTGYTGGNNFDTGSGPLEFFGQSVALQGLQLAVGAIGDAGASGLEPGSGAVYLFSFADSAFTNPVEEGRIGAGYLGPKDYSLNLSDSDGGFFFGSAVSLDSGRLVVGAATSSGRNSSAAGSGAVYLFKFGDPASFFDARLVDVLGSGYQGFSNYTVPGLSDGTIHQFGTSVALDGLRLAVGSAETPDTTGGLNTGAVYLFSFADDAFGAPLLEGIIGLGYSGGKNVSVATLDSGDRFGEAVSLRGNRLAVGASLDDGVSNTVTDAGAVYLFTFADALFSGGTLQATIGADYVGGNNLSPANINTGDSFGASVSLDGTRLAVGAPQDGGDDDPFTNVGAVYLFTFADTQFTGGALAAIVGSGYGGGNNLSIGALAGGNQDRFGSGVALQGTRLLVGTPGDDGNANSLGDSGAVYVIDFATTAFTGGTVSALIGSGYTGGTNVDVTALSLGDRFGSSVAIDGQKIAVGAVLDNGAGGAVPLSGAAYLFTDIAGTYTLAQRIGAGYTGAGNLSLGGLDGEDRFGSGVALSGNRLVVGAPEDSGVFNTSGGLGAVYLFTFSDDAFNNLALAGTVGVGYGPQQNLSVGQATDAEFGGAVALSGTRLAIGSPFDRGFSGDSLGLGAVFLVTFNDEFFSAPQLRGIIGEGYTGAGNFDVSVLDMEDSFGSALAIDGLRLAIGAPLDDGFNNATTDSGAVYLFTFANTAFGSPVLEARMGAGYTGFKNVDVAGLEAGDQFGSSVTLRGNQLAVGAQADDGFNNLASDSGAAYLFTFTSSIFNNGTLEGIGGVGYTGGKNFSVAGLAAGDFFGSALAFTDSGEGLAIGASQDDGDGDSNGNSGAVYLFDFADTVFSSALLLATIGSGYSGPNDLSIATLGTNANFGAALAVSGSKLVVGTPGGFGVSGGGVNVGGAYLFTFTTPDLDGASLSGRITAGSIDASNLLIDGLNTDGNRLGSSVALDGNRMVLGAAGSAGNISTPSAGAVYLFTFSDDVYNDLVQAGTLGSGYAMGRPASLAAQGIGPEERFGAAVSLDGLRLAIGASDDNGASSLKPLSGAVYLLSFADLAFGAPVLEAVIGSGYGGGKNLSVAGLDASDFFGSAVSLRGTQLAVGASGDDGAANSAADAGAVYLFSFADLAFGGAEQRSILGQGYAGGSNLGVAGLAAGDGFGSSLSLDQQLGRFRLAVGAPNDDGQIDDRADIGAIYVFSFVDDLFNAPAVAVRIGRYSTGLDVDISGGDQGLRPGDNFGSAVGLSGLRLAGGAAGNNGLGNAAADSGAVYLLTFADADFGGVNLRGIIGRDYDTPGSAFNIATLDTFDGFGGALSLDGNRLAVGARGDDGFTNGLPDPGAVYLFSFADGSFGGAVREATIGSGYTGGKTIAVPLDAFDLFGTSVSLDGNRMAVGTRQDDGPGNTQTDTGAVYLFTFADETFNGGRLVGTIGAGYRSSVGLDLAASVTPTVVQVGSGDSFGTAVSLDGNRLAIGAPDDDGSIDGLGDSGAVYLFTFADANFGGATLQATIGHGYVGGKNLWPTEIGAGDQFGFAVSLDGNRLAVGAPRDDGASDAQSNAGAVYLFSFTDPQFGGGLLEGIAGIGYTGGKNLSVADLEADDRFGSSVSLDGNRMAVGAIGDDGWLNPPASGREIGAVYLFSFAGAEFQSGSLQAIFGLGFEGVVNDRDILLDDGDAFGWSVSLDGTRLAVGARGDDGNSNGLSDSGAVYLFTFDDLDFNGGLQRGIVGASYSGPGDVDTVLTPFGFASGSFFGTSVSLDGNRLAIGGPGINSGASSPPNSGAVYLLTFTDSIFGGGSIAEILARGADNFGANLDFDVELEDADAFGTSVSLDGNRLVVGARGDDGFGNGAASTDSGAVYLFTFADTDFSGAQLRGTIGAGYTRGLGTPVAGVGEFDAFGTSVSLDGQRLAIGVPGDAGFGNSLTESGAVYLFTFVTTDFEFPILEGVIGSDYTGGKNLSVPELRAGARFGSSVSLSNLTLAVGATGDRGFDDDAPGAGAVYLFGFDDDTFNAPAQLAIIGKDYALGANFNLALDNDDLFGWSVSLDSDRLAVGAIGDDGDANGTQETGAVYLFDVAAGVPGLIGTIGRGYTLGANVDTTAFAGVGDSLGSAVALNGTRLAVGAFFEDGSGDAANMAGAVYLFTFADTAFDGGTLAGTIGVGYDLTLPTSTANELLGSALSLEGNVLAIGAYGDSGFADDRPQAGAVYLISFADAAFANPSLSAIFGRGYTGGSNVAVAGLDANDLFGNGVSMNAGRLVVGASGDDGPENQIINSGAVYFFDLDGVSPDALGLGFGDTPGADVTITPTALVDILAGGTAVELQANNDITVSSAILVSAGGAGGDLTFRAGRSILINAGITTDGGNFTAVANEFLSGGVVDGFRDPGDAVITFGPGAFIDAGSGFASLRIVAGDDKSFFDSGAMTIGSITASSIVLQNLGVTGNRAVTLDADALLTASATGDAVLIESDIFTNNAGAGVFNLTGGGRFLIYSNDYDVIDRGGLVGNNLYNNVSPSGFAGNLFIFARQPVLTFTADDATRTYGQAPPGYSFSFSGLVNGDSDTYAFSGAPNLFDTLSAGSGAGIDTIFIDQGTLLSHVGYDFDFVNGALTTLRALLTVTANDATRTYGDSNPMFTASFSGFVNGDDASVVSGLNFTTLADEFSDVGTYSISPFEAFAANYDFDYIPGTLTITKALLTVTADSATREYGLANPAFTGSITGFRNSDDDSVVSGLVYGSAATITSNVGSFAITGSGASATNYDFSYVPGILTITRALLTVTADNATREYGLANPTFTGSISGFRNGDTASVVSGLTFGSTAVLNSGIGTYSIIGSGATSTNYNFSYVPGTLTITRALLTVTANDASREYGLANPTFTGSISGLRAGDTASVVSGLVYGTTATTASNVGTFAITASGGAAANYDFSYVPGTLTITRALLTVTANDATREYGLANPTFTGNITGFRNSDTASVVSGHVYVSAAKIESNVGTFAITGSGATATNYDFSYVPGTLTITRALLTVTADDATREYGLADPAFTGSITGFRNGDTASVISGLAYGSTAVLNSGIGTYSIIGSGATSTNYNFSYVPGTLTITRALLTVTANDATREYGLANPTFTGSISGLRAGDTASVVSGLVYGTTATVASNVGTFAITASGGAAANYDFSYVPGTLTITRALLTVTANDATREYGLANPTFTGNITGFRNSDTASVVSGLVYGSAATIASNVGTFAITGSGASATNYDFSYVPGTLTITRALLTVTANDATREYGLADPAFTGSITGFRNGDTASVISGLTYGSTAVLNSGIGTYSITGSGATSTNYDFSYVPGTLTITRALLTVTANDASREYGLANPTFTGSISGLRAGDTASVVSGLVYGTTATVASNVGTFAITASGGAAANYDFSYVPGTLTITRALLTVTANDATREYGLANPTFTGNIIGFRNSDTASVVSGLVYGSAATIASNVGTFAITGSGAAATNYDFSYVPGTLTITRALLTVTANDATREYGLADPAFTGSITGFRNGDTASVVSGLTYGSTAVLNSGIGTYSITGSGATSTNYDFSYVPGTLTITRALLTVTANDASREYGLANPTFTGSISGLRAGDTASVVSGLVYGTTATVASNVGTFAITVSGGAAANYDFSYVPGTLTITRALLTVTANDATREYGLANPTFTGSITGFRNSDTASVVSGLVYGSAATIASNVGTFAITGSGATATNYDFSYVPGTLTITRALLTVTANDATREYGLANPAFTGSVTGFRNSDTASVISGLVYGSVAAIGSDVGAYAITGSGATAVNYDFAYVPGTLTITRALLTVTANNATRAYGLANPAFTGSISGLRNGDSASVAAGLVFGSVATTGSDVGSYAITGSGATAINYDFAYVPGTLTITRALLTISADNKSREYGLANPALTSTIAGLRNGDTASVVNGLVLATGATQGSGVGSYAIGISGGSALNYDFAYVPGSLTITPAPLSVTIDSKTRVYGTANPVLTASISGLRNGDTDAVVSGLRLRTGAIARSDVGDYLITGSGAVAANYRFDYVPGTLTITKALLQVRVNNATREYGLANPEFSALITGFRNGDRANVVSGLVFGTPATIGSDIGSYAITASGASALNYDFVYTPGRLTIDQARLLITANNVVMHQGNGDPVLTVSYSGLRNGDTGDVVTGLVLRSTGGGTAAPGQYVINASRGTARNYQITYRPGVMTVLPPIVPPAQDPPGTGGGPNPPAANPPAANPPAGTPPAGTPPAGAPPPGTPPVTDPPGTSAPVTPPPPGGGTSVADPVAVAPVGTAAPSQPPSATPVAAPIAVITMPGQGSVSVPVPPDSTAPLQVLQGLAAPLPVLMAPETRPVDAAAPGTPSRDGGQRTGCTYISLCSAAPTPLWTFQPAQ